MAEIKVKLRGFYVPDSITVDLPYPADSPLHHFSPPGVLLEKLSAEVLDELCTEFRAQVFRKADKADPALREREPMRPDVTRAVG